MLVANHRDEIPFKCKRSKHHKHRAGVLLPKSIRVLKHGIPVSSQATSSQSIMAFLTGSRSMTGVSEPLRKVGAVLAVERYVLAIDVKVHTPAVELDFLQPVRARRRHLCQRGRHRLDEGNFTQHGGLWERTAVYTTLVEPCVLLGENRRQSM